MGIVPSSLAVAALATSTPDPAVAALATSAPGLDPSGTIASLLSLFDPAMPLWLALSSDPRFAFLTMLIGLSSPIIGLSNLKLNIQNTNSFAARRPPMQQNR